MSYLLKGEEDGHIPSIQRVGGCPYIIYLKGIRVTKSYLFKKGEDGHVLLKGQVGCHFPSLEREGE